MKKYFFLSLLFFGQLFSITSEKFGDYINLAICVTPYVVALWNYQQQRVLQEQGTSEQEVKKEHPYRLIGFGKYGSEMITYLGAMFLSQKFLWSLTTQYFAKTYPNISGTNAYAVYSMLGAIVGMVSATIGILSSKGIKAVEAKYIFKE